MSEPVTTAGNPNARVAGGSGTATVGLVWFLGNVWPKIALSAEAGAGIATVVASVTLVLGRNGLAGVKNALLHGWKK